MSLQEAIFKFLREGDDHTPSPEDLGLQMELGEKEHAYLARVLTAFIERNYDITRKDETQVKGPN